MTQITAEYTIETDKSPEVLNYASELLIKLLHNTGVSECEFITYKAPIQHVVVSVTCNYNKIREAEVDIHHVIRRYLI